MYFCSEFDGVRTPGCRKLVTANIVTVLNGNIPNFMSSREVGVASAAIFDKTEYCVLAGGTPCAVQ